MPTAAANSTVVIHGAVLTSSNTNSAGIQMADANRFIDPSREVAMRQLSSMAQIIEYLKVLYR